MPETAWTTQQQPQSSGLPADAMALSTYKVCPFLVLGANMHEHYSHLVLPKGCTHVR